MATKDELIAKLAVRRYNKVYAPNLTRQQLKQAAQGMTDQEWDRIIAELKPGGDIAVVGRVLAAQVKDHLMALAITDVTAQLADDTLTTTELLEYI